SAEIIQIIKADDQNSSVIVFGGPSYDWRAASRATDVTDELIQGAVGYKKDVKKSQHTKKKDVEKSSNKVFIVHGHDSELKNDIDIFLRDLGLEPIILHRKADEGLTIIEKFERHSDVVYAFILLTPDDVGMTLSEYQKEESTRKIEFRA